MGNKRLAAGMRPMGPNQLDWIIYKGLCICLELSVKQGRRGLLLLTRLYAFVKAGVQSWPQEDSDGEALRL